jgi:hypothetical protein
MASPDVTTTNESDWENGELGRDEKHVRRSPPERERAVDAALDLQLISLRLQKELIEQLKFIANYRGVGYQPLIRDILCRWSRSEVLAIAQEMKRELEAKETISATRKRA